MHLALVVFFFFHMLVRVSGQSCDALQVLVKSDGTALTSSKVCIEGAILSSVHTDGVRDLQNEVGWAGETTKRQKQKFVTFCVKPASCAGARALTKKSGVRN